MTRKSVPQIPEDGWSADVPAAGETTHRYGRAAAAEIRAAIADARGAAPGTPDMAEVAAPVAENTERYSDRSVAGIRAAIAAARDAEAHPAGRSPRRALAESGDAPKLPSLILAPRPETPPEDGGDP